MTKLASSSPPRFSETAMRRLTLPTVTVVAVTLMPLLPAGADPVFECYGSNQIEISNCLAETETRANAAVQSAYEFARSAAEELDSITERTVAVPALEASQAAWEAYRDSQCEYVGTTFGGGSGTGIAILGCRITAARDRADTLIEIID